jgi:hypothetical protein
VANAVSGSIHTTSASGSGGSGSSTAPPFDASTVKPTDGDSLFAQANFARALGLLRGHTPAGAKISDLAVYPGYISATVDSGGSELNIYIDADSSVQVTNTGGSTSGDATFRLSLLAPGGPAQLIGRIAAAGHVPEAQLAYLVIDGDPISGRIEYLAYPASGNRVEYFHAGSPTGRLTEYLTNGSGPRTVR